MALEIRPLEARLQIQLDMGLDGTGKKITRTKTFSKIRNDVEDQELYDVANALIGLQSNSPLAIRRIEQSEYVNV